MLDSILKEIKMITLIVISIILFVILSFVSIMCCLIVSKRADERERELFKKYEDKLLEKEE